MRRSLSDWIRARVRPVLLRRRAYFCQEPWVGTFSVGADGDVVCCPCYAQVKIGNVNESTVQEIWNSSALLEMRNAFRQGRLPRSCKGQLCPVVVGEETPMVGDERSHPVKPIAQTHA